MEWELLWAMTSQYLSENVYLLVRGEDRDTLPQTLTVCSHMVYYLKLQVLG